MATTRGGIRNGIIKTAARCDGTDGVAVGTVASFMMFAVCLPASRWSAVKLQWPLQPLPGVAGLAARGGKKESNETKVGLKV